MLKPILIFIVAPFVWIVLLYLGLFMVAQQYPFTGLALMILSVLNSLFLIEYAGNLLKNGKK